MYAKNIALWKDFSTFYNTKHSTMHALNVRFSIRLVFLLSPSCPAPLKLPLQNSLRNPYRVGANTIFFPSYTHFFKRASQTKPYEFMLMPTRPRGSSKAMEYVTVDPGTWIKMDEHPA